MQHLFRLPSSLQGKLSRPYSVNLTTHKQVVRVKDVTMKLCYEKPDNNNTKKAKANQSGKIAFSNLFNLKSQKKGQL